jgi:type II secretory pathway predicted ATPase ExeA
MRGYAEYFGFKTEPFERAPDADMFYFSEQHEKALNIFDSLLISDAFSTAVLTGARGTGKTVTLLHFLGELPEDIICIYIRLPNLGGAELLKTILESLGVETVGVETAGQTGYTELFINFIAEAGDAGRKVLIVTEDAHTFHTDTLAELFSIPKRCGKSAGVLKIIVAGEPALKEILSAPQYNIKERLAGYAELGVLNPPVCGEYIAHRFKLAGRSIPLSKSLIKRLNEAAGGNPVLVNTIMKRFILAAYFDRSEFLKEKHLHTALNSLNIKIREKKRGFFLYAAALISLATLVLIGTDYFLSKKIREKLLAEPVTVSAQPYDAEVPRTEENPFERSDSDPDFAHGSGTFASVGVSVLNLRTMPELGADKLAVLREGDRVLVLEELPEWLKVELESGKTGWVYKPYIKINNIN